jgi:hypothetical protein
MSADRDAVDVRRDLLRQKGRKRTNERRRFTLQTNREREEPMVPLNGLHGTLVERNAQ